MHWSNLYLIPLLAAAVSLSIGIYLRRRRDLKSDPALIVMFFASAQWSLGYFFELYCSGIDAKILWDNIQFLGYTLLAPATLIFILHHTDHKSWIKGWLIPVLAVEPLLTNVLAWTNRYHGLIRRSPGIRPLGTIELLSYDWGVWMWVSTIYGLLLFFLGLLLLLSRLINTPARIRSQTIFLLVGLLIPWIGGLVIFTSKIDIMPLLFTIGYAVMAFGVGRHNLFRFNPATYKTIIDNVINGIVILDSRKRIVELNPSAEQMLGTTNREAAGLYPEEVIAPSSSLEEYFDEAEEREGEISRKVQGRRKYYIIYTRPLYDTYRVRTGWVVVLEDITRRKEVENSLHIFNRAIENTRASVVITNTDAEISYVNPFFEEVTGYSKKEAVGENPRILQSGRHGPEFYHEMWDNLTRGKTWRGELLNSRKNKQLYWENAIISPIKNEKGEIINYIGVKEDITERKKLEELKEEVDRISRHDLKSPLNGIIGLPEIMKEDDNLNERQQQILDMISDSGQNVLSMVNLSLAIYQIEQGVYTYQEENIDMLKVINKSYRDVKSIAAAKHIVTRITAEGFTEQRPEQINACGEELLAYSVFSNLLKNAVEASPEGEEVVIQIRLIAPDTQDAHSRIECGIRNKGTVPESIRDSFFDKYATIGKKGGTGLGTYSAKLLAEAQGWSISMNTSEEAGTAVILNLPTADEE